jgi:hypothetical protein
VRRVADRLQRQVHRWERTSTPTDARRRSRRRRHPHRGSPAPSFGGTCRRPDAPHLHTAYAGASWVRMLCFRDVGPRAQVGSPRREGASRSFLGRAGSPGNRLTSQPVRPVATANPRSRGPQAPTDRAHTVRTHPKRPGTPSGLRALAARVYVGVENWVGRDRPSQGPAPRRASGCGARPCRQAKASTRRTRSVTYGAMTRRVRSLAARPVSSWGAWLRLVHRPGRE